MTSKEQAPVLWFTGLSGAGKTTLANALKIRLVDFGIQAEILDGDEVRRELSPELGFSKHDRDLQIKRLAWIAGLLAKNGVTVLVSAISPYRQSRSRALATFQRGYEIYISTPLEVLEQRDTKGLYRRARSGEISAFTGIDDPYEAPLSPHLQVDTSTERVEDTLEKLVSFIKGKGIADDFR